MGGSGKTTLSKVVYNEIGHYFEGKNFLSNIREVSKQHNGLVYLQQQLIADIIKSSIMKLPNSERAKFLIQERLPRRKSLIVLDDVDSLSQLMALCGSRERFCPGSVIIITTRDVHLLKDLKADQVYRMKEMNESESLELLSWHAFKQPAPPENFMELSRNLVVYSGGLPLALEVLGCHLFERTIEEWEYVLFKLKSIPNDEIQRKLRISFDGLKDYMEQDIFPDMCFFFINKDREYVTQILNGCGFHAKIGIQILIERSPISVSRDNKLEMHDLIRDMGREIIHGSPPKYLEERGRLCFHEEVLHVLTEQTATKAIEGIALKLPRTDSKTLIEAKAFKFLRWLKTLTLSHSSFLRQTPDFKKLPNLEKLILKDCPSLISVHQSIGDLKNLLLVSLKDCKCLRDLPRSIYKLKSLKTLILSNCSMIDHLEEDFEQMESLTTLMADKTAITQIPRSLVSLEGLKHGNGISSLVFSAVQNGSFHGLSPVLGNLARLRGMWEECRLKFQFSGKMARLLDALYETANFMELESTSDTPQFSHMEASASSEGHDQVHIERATDSYNSLLIQMGLNNGRWDDSHLPGDEYPDWFIYKGEGRSVLFKAPQVMGCCLKAVVLNIVFVSCIGETTTQFLINVLIINYTKATVQHHNGDSTTFHEDAEWQSIISSIQPHDLVELVLCIGSQFTVKKFAAYLAYDGSKRRRLLN
ncbi:disease resistance protein Roq1-like [Prosopis cineraria]|uniref:disease resistance protein Roq1-like n=1 Tax=Prosopis cineraria TaxID=364024 RepID=UPI00240F1587|nr:disease resistance protein Roq1-like [Prosopis cineraria]